MSESFPLPAECNTRLALVHSDKKKHFLVLVWSHRPVQPRVCKSYSYMFGFLP